MAKCIVCFAMVLALMRATASGAEPSAQERFATILAAASVAESLCDMKGYAQKAKAYIDGFHSGFDLKNPEDLKLVTLKIVGAKSKADEMGKRAWCIEYRAQMNLIGGFN